MLHPPSLTVNVFTGDRKYAGTDNTVSIILHGKDGKSSKPTTLDTFFHNDFERGQADTFKIAADVVKDFDQFVEIEVLEIRTDKTFGVISDDWFVDKIVVENKTNNTSFVFPILRWIRTDQRYFIQHLDTSLPQFDKFKEQRSKELAEKRKDYVYEQKIRNGPVQLKTLPPDEEFSFNYEWDITKTVTKLKVLGKLKLFGMDEFETFKDFEKLYDDLHFVRPKSSENWRSDIAFGHKRINSINPSVIRRFTKIPDKFPVTDELLGPLLEGYTIQQGIDNKKLYWTDLEILEGTPINPGFILCIPMLLLFVDKEKNLRPVAIQLFQKPGPDNPIFTPQDDPSLWTFVKMWYDNADCCYHQSLTHLGFTHLLMGGIAIATHRNLSPSHPIFKILAPHFLYIHAINALALDKLVAPGGWVDKTMSHGAEGLLHLTTRGIDSWRMNVEGNIPEAVKQRGIEDSEALPNFYWRDDALVLFKTIRKYVSSYVNIYYSSQDILKEDEEIQAWVEEIVKERNNPEGGVGIKGVPGNGALTCNHDLVDIITSIIFVCSCAHASANFGQYDEYAFPPNYPTNLRQKPPSSKDARYTEKEMCKSLALSEMTKDILVVTTILSKKGTNSLGDFEVDYIADPKAKTVVEEFRADLCKISKQIKARNEKVGYNYDDLIPENIPNSISI